MEARQRLLGLWSVFVLLGLRRLLLLHFLLLLTLIFVLLAAFIAHGQILS